MIFHEHNDTTQHISKNDNESKGINKLKTIIKIGEFIYVDVIDIALY